MMAARDPGHAVPLRAIQIDDRYWNRYIRLIPEKAIPYQWEILNDRVPDAPPSYCLRNFRIACGEAAGRRGGTIFQDSDVYKWLESVAYSLAAMPDPELERRADDVIALLGRAQEADGYLNTYYQLVEPGRRWSNLTGGHELYCAGHLIEAAVAYYDATQKDDLLKIAMRCADLICRVFGAQGENHPGWPGHPEIELALVRLYGAAKEQRYLDMARSFVDRRGTLPNYFEQEQARPDYRPAFPEFAHYDLAYAQAHLPVRRQMTAEGHCVRAVYLYAAMTDLAVLDGDEALLAQCETLWNNLVKRRMYLTGSIGSSGVLERFTTDFDLPNDANYSETCASIGLALFGLRMTRATADASYMDIVERALYNTVCAGIALSGDRYFYVNPLEVWPEACMPHTSRAHVQPVRQKWFDVACCPTNIARTLTSLGQYLYSLSADTLYVNLYIQNQASFAVGAGRVQVRLDTDFPRSGSSRLRICAEEGTRFSLALRIPEYAEDFRVRVNGAPAAGHVQKGYFYVQGIGGTAEVDVDFSVTPRFVRADPRVRANIGKVAVMRGPVVYCLEECDNGALLAGIFVDAADEIKEAWRDDLLGGTMTLALQGKKLDENGQVHPISLTAIPYGLWCNREPGEMLVWIRESRPV